jgi:hypothetical protein
MRVGVAEDHVDASCRAVAHTTAVSILASYRTAGWIMDNGSRMTRECWQAVPRPTRERSTAGTASRGKPGIGSTDGRGPSPRQASASGSSTGAVRGCALGVSTPSGCSNSCGALPKSRYRGRAKNTARAFVMFALATPYMVRKRLLSRGAQCLQN